jgi:hypothetical protein
MNHIFNPALSSDNTLHVVGVCSNPARWQSRYKLFRRWVVEMLHTPGVKLYVVEGVFGDHQGECAPLPGQNYAYKQVKLDSTELWLKENMLNISIRSMLPVDWKYVCISDTDLHYRNTDWAHGALRALQTYNVIQPWSQGTALLSDGSARVPIDSSFGYLSSTKQKMSWGKHSKLDGYTYAHCGYSWAFTRFFWENLPGGLIDFCLIGSADHHMCWSMVGKSEDTCDGRMSQGYKDALQAWSVKAHMASGGMVGYVPGIVEHGHHGPLIGRDYGGRWQILVDIGFNPKTDIMYDGQGVIHYIGPFKSLLQQRMIAYNRTRKEDSTEA